MDKLNLFIPITKVDAAQRLVYGLATAEAEDRSGEICDYASTKPYYEKWSSEIAKSTSGKSLGNLRAMHGHIAAGKVTALTFNDTAKQIEICAKVVDDAEWNKVQEGVYTGFSQGGAYVKRWQDEAGLQRYTADPAEISLVDLPCLQSATFEMIKADGASERRGFVKVVKMPTSAEVAKRAEELAKAAGNATNWAAFIDAARTELEKAAVQAGHDGQDGFNGQAAVGDATERWTVSSTDETGKKANQSMHASKPEADAEADRRKGEGHKDIVVAVGKAVAADLSKSSGEDGEWEQVWRSTRDGATFKTKGELRKHHEDLDAAELVKSAAGPAIDALKDIAAGLGITKKDYSDDDRKKMAESGEAMEDGSYPIKNKADLENAVQSYGRAKDKDAAKKHITARAKALDATDLLPADWPGSTKKEEKVAASSDLGKGLPTAAALLYLAERLHELKHDIFMEEKQEADQTSVPGQLKQNFDNLLDSIGDYVMEELAELKNGQNVDMLYANPASCDVIIACAAALPKDHLAALTKFAGGKADLEKFASVLGKAGARNSKADLDKIQAMHDHSCDLGAVCKADNCEGGAAEKVQESAGLAKVAGELAKMTAERDALKQAIDTQIMPLLTEIGKRVKNIESQPMPLPFSGMPRAVSKTQDGAAEGTAEEQLEKMMATPEGREAMSLLMIKAAQKQGQPMALAR